MIAFNFRLVFTKTAKKYISLIFTLGLILLSSGCNFFESIFYKEDGKKSHSPTEDSSKEDKILEISESSLLSKEKFCGDILPQNEIDYPVKLYPVVINYNELKIDKIKTFQCSFIVEKDDEQIIFSLFLSKHNAEKFIANSTLRKATVGKPVTVNDPPNLQVAKLAQLNMSQVHYLTYIASKNYISPQEKKPFQIIVPTHIPPNFRIVRARIISGYKYTMTNNNKPSSHYQLIYEGMSGECFMIEGIGGFLGTGGDTSGYEEINIKSNVLGNIPFLYTQEDDPRGEYFLPALGVFFITSDGYFPPEEATYVFQSSSAMRSRSLSYQCKMLAVPELVKIFKSVKYFYPSMKYRGL
jgi:hypothetical protein